MSDSTDITVKIRIRDGRATLVQAEIARNGVDIGEERLTQEEAVLRLSTTYCQELAKKIWTK